MLTLDELAHSYETLTHFSPSVDQRKSWARSGVAMPDGSFFIRNRSDLSNAISAVGRATPNASESEVARRNSVRRHVIKRARALGLSSMIPDTWNSDGSLKQSSIADEVENFLKHFGVRGMKWGVRRGDNARGALGIHRPPKVPASAESVRARALQAQVRRSGTQSLSNRDLQTLVTRLNLERQYSSLNQKQVSQGQKFVAGIARNYAQQEAGKFIADYAPKGAAWVAKKIAKRAAVAGAGIATQAAITALL